MSIKFSMKKIILFLYVIFINVSGFAIGVSDADVKKVLNELDEALSKRRVFVEKRIESIDSLKKLYYSTDIINAQLDVIMQIADSYNGFDNDSALHYYSKGLDMALHNGVDSIALKFRLNRAVILPLAGFIKDAVDEYDVITQNTLHLNYLELYYAAGRQMYSYIASFYPRYPAVFDYWNKKAIDCQTQLINILKPDTPKRMLNVGEYFYSIGEYSKSEAILMELMNLVAIDSNVFAIASHIVSDIAKERNEKNKFVYYLVLSAIADVKSATLEVVSLQELGEYLYEIGDVERAYNYSSIALDNAVECNALMRMIQTSKALPIIEKAHKAEMQSSQNRIYLIIAVMALLLIILVLTLLFLRKEMHRLSILRARLEKANHVKEIYISQFMNLCSIYMDKLHQFCQLAHRKITTGKVDELLRLTKSGKFVEEQSREFYSVFDDAFLHIYPDFVASVNSLLRSDEQIMLGAEEKLNTDLRILAFMRLGVEESTRIAQVLNYSVNTIYTYRNKMKNRAINRETFEADVMKIGSMK